MTSNKLPPVMRKPVAKKGEEDYELRERYNNYMAFMTRCKLHEMHTSHMNRDHFPYNADELAIYMHYLINKMVPVVDEEYISDSSVDLVAPTAQAIQFKKIIAEREKVAQDLNEIKLKNEDLFKDIPKRKQESIKEL